MYDDYEEFCEGEEDEQPSCKLCRDYFETLQHISAKIRNLADSRGAIGKVSLNDEEIERQMALLKRSRESLLDALNDHEHRYV